MTTIPPGRNRQFLYGKTLLISLLAAACLLLACSAIEVLAQKNDIAALSLQPREIFSSTATLTDKGKPQEVRCTLSRWLIPPHKRIAEFPVHAFLLIQLRAGGVITAIDGTEEKHVTGDYWVVPANAKMSVQCVGEACTLDVMTLSLP